MHLVSTKIQHFIHFTTFHFFKITITESQYIETVIFITFFISLHNDKVLKFSGHTINFFLQLTGHTALLVGRSIISSTRTMNKCPPNSCAMCTLIKNCCTESSCKKESSLLFKEENWNNQHHQMEFLRAMMVDQTLKNLTRTFDDPTFSLISRMHSSSRFWTVKVPLHPAMS